MAYIKLGNKKIKLTTKLTMQEVIDAAKNGDRLLTDIPGRVCKMIGAKTEEEVGLVFHDDRAIKLLKSIVDEYRIHRDCLIKSCEISKSGVAGWFCNPWSQRYYPPTKKQLQKIADRISNTAGDAMRREIEMMKAVDMDGIGSLKI